MKAADKRFLFDLLNTPSPTGFEVAGQRKWAAYVRKCADTVENDAYGNTWATLNGGGRGTRKRVMLEAHADEIGYIIQCVTDEGFLRIDRIGGSDAATARGRRIVFLGDNGPVKGVIGNTAIHLRKRIAEEKAPKPHELYVDVGASSREDVAELGLRVGHPAVYADSVEEFGQNKLVGRALDNRIGGFIIAQVLARLAPGKSGRRPAATLCAVNAVQEEIGGHGARMVTQRLKPDFAVVLDVTHATDSPGIDKARHGEVKLGGGPTVTHGTANHPLVVERLMEVAEKAGIPLQHEASSRSTSTDTDTIYSVHNGIPSALVSLPLRYMHSSVEVADLEDVKQTTRLLAEFVKSIKIRETFSVSV